LGHKKNDMYFKVSMRTNPETKIYGGYYRLVESYRNQDNRVCHHTVLNAGYLDDFSVEQLNLIQKILTIKVKNAGSNSFIDLPYTDDIIVNQHVEKFYNRMIAEKRIDIYDAEKEAKKAKQNRELVKAESIRHKDVREIGAEWLSYQALGQLQISQFLEKQGWNQEDIQLAQSHIISRAVYPASELETARWIQENSSVCEVTSYDIDKITKDKLYKISKK